jgi:hypothetical protein
LQYTVDAEDLLAIQQDIEVNAVALARIAVFMISTGLPARIQSACDP